MLRQPLLLLGLLLIIGMGSYRAFRFGPGRRRYLGLVPLALLVLGGALVPLVFGVLQGAGIRPSLMGIGAAELLLVMVTGSLLLAVVSGAILSLVFRPRVAGGAR